jgi:anti-sigma factor (TIGR02949 family)
MHPGARAQSEKCIDVFAKLSEYLDGELPPDVCVRIGEHLAGCQACAESLAELRRTVEVCRNYQGREAPLPVREELREQLLEAYRRVLARNR